MVMVINIILFSIVFIALIIGTITDIKTREVPDWLNFALIFTGIGLRAIYSVINSEWMFLIYGLIGLSVSVVIAYLMFYTGQWGGGDAKLLMGLGALIGLPLIFNPFPLLLVFMINVLLIGAIYGLIYSLVLAFVNRKSFVKNLKKVLFNKKMINLNKICLSFSIFFIVLMVFLVEEHSIRLLFILLLLFAYLSFYLIVFIKAVELSAMYKRIDVSKLTEGDWIAENYVVGKNKICGPKDLGITKKQINQLIALNRKKKLKKIKIKEGIPFVPSFLIAFLISLMFGAWWMFLL